MSIAIVNDFGGGQAEDVRTFATNQQETSFNFDIYTNPHQIAPYVDTIAETVSGGSPITDFAITDVDVIPFAGGVNFVALGEASTVSAAPKVFVKNSSSDITAAWEAKASGVNNAEHGTLVVYKDFAYFLGDTGSTHNLQKYDSNVTISTIGTITTANYSATVPRPFVHPEDNVLYMAEGNIIASYDGSAFTGVALTLPSNKVVVSLDNYGAYLAITCRPKNGGGKSMCYLWGRDSTLNTLQGVIDLGYGQVNIGVNLYDNLYFVMSKSKVGNYTNIREDIITIKGYGGGTVETLKEFVVSSLVSGGINILKQKADDKLYFALSNDTSLYCFGKNKSGEYTLSHDRGYPTGALSITGISLIGDFLWIAYNTASTNNFFHRTLSLSESATYSTVSSYTTTINPAMLLEDRYRKKTLEAVSMSFTGRSSAILSVAIDGSAMDTIISNAETGEVTVEATKLQSTGALGVGREFQFKVQGNLKLKEIRYRYSVNNTQGI